MGLTFPHFTKVKDDTGSFKASILIENESPLKVGDTVSIHALQKKHSLFYSRRSQKLKASKGRLEF